MFTYAYVFLFIRFFPDVPDDSDRNGNCKPGTVVDTMIVVKHAFDFCKFLLIHIFVLLICS